MKSYRYTQNGRFEVREFARVAARRRFPWLLALGVVLALVILALALYDVAPAMVWPFVVR